MVGRRSILRDHRASPVETIVDARLHDMVVGAEAAEWNQRGRRGEARIAEVVVLIFELARPVLGEHVFEAGADGPTVVAVAGEAERDRRARTRHHRLVVVGEGITALYIEQAGTPSVADAAGDRTKTTLVVGVDLAAREDDAAVVAGNKGVLGFSTDHPVRVELVVSPALEAAEETAVAVVAGDEAVEIAVTREHADEVATDIEAGPVIERSGIGRGLGVGRVAYRKVGSKCWHGRAEGDEGHSCE